MGGDFGPLASYDDIRYDAVFLINGIKRFGGGVESVVNGFAGEIDIHSVDDGAGNFHFVGTNLC